VSGFLGLQKRVLDDQAIDLLPVLQVFGQQTIGSASEGCLQDQGVPKETDMLLLSSIAASIITSSTRTTGSRAKS
jgi:hypothetical protein